MKIVEIGPGLLPIPTRKFGAIERVIWSLNIALAIRGHKVIIHNRKQFNPRKLPKDAVIHCHWTSHAHKLIEAGIPYAYTSHSHIWEQTCRRAINGSKVYLALHEGMVPPEYDGHVEIVGNGVDTTFWYDLGQKREKVIVSCGNYSSRKRLEWMFDLIDLLPKEWRGIIVGPGVPENLSKKKHSRVELRGEVVTDELRDLYNRCSIGFHPAKAEAFALVPLEMAACGLVTYVADESYCYGRRSPILKIVDVQHAASCISDYDHCISMAPYQPEAIASKTKALFSWGVVAKKVERGLRRMIE